MARLFSKSIRPGGSVQKTQRPTILTTMLPNIQTPLLNKRINLPVALLHNQPPNLIRQQIKIHQFINHILLLNHPPIQQNPTNQFIQGLADINKFIVETKVIA
jgi:hypothetical protein